MPHDLVIIFKGFARGESLAAHEECLQGVPHKRVYVGDYGFDVRPYLKVAREHPHRHFMFLNSFSQVLVPGWLELLFRHVNRSQVGLVGATGSHQSIVSDAPVLWAERRADANALRRVRYAISIWRRFPVFPNPHLRTNGFLAPRDVLLRVHHAPILTKWAAYRFESGIGSMTRQVVAAGLTPLVAAADGRAYEPEAWPEARTFWISRQENLLVSDNQTRVYAKGDASTRERLAYFAWRRHPDGRLRDDAPGATR